MAKIWRPPRPLPQSRHIGLVGAAGAGVFQWSKKLDTHLQVVISSCATIAEMTLVNTHVYGRHGQLLMDLGEFCEVSKNKNFAS